MNSTVRSAGRATRPRALRVPVVSGLSAKAAAHAYLDAGLMPHPWRVKGRTKVSCYSGFKFQDISETHQSIEHWNPAWQCGLVCSRASGLMAIDIDSRDEFRAWAEQEGLVIPATAWARTGGGGSHLLFDARGLEDWPAQGKLPGADLKANGFIAVEPSLHPNGRPYVWVSREIAPVGALASSLGSYRPAPAPATEGDPDALRRACLEAGDGDQHAALLAYVQNLQWRGYASDDIVRLCESLGLTSFREREPWTASDFRGLIRQGEQYVATPAEREMLAGLPSPESLRLSAAAERAPGWHNFAALVAGNRKRAVPVIFPRADGQALFYRGKEHTIYGETESGKDMLLVALAKWCIENGLSVMWTDFEEGDELEIGSRLLNTDLERHLLTDQGWFRYATPATKVEADACLRDVTRWKPDVAIWDGVTAAYGVYGWQLKENDSATAFRSHLVRPCLAAGVATIGTDHVTKDGTGGRYAIGGVMKLNMVNGSSYLIDAVSPIVRYGDGASRLILTKDRPGGVKPECAKMKSPTMRFAGMLTVKSSGDGPGELLIDVIPPLADEAELEGIAEGPKYAKTQARIASVIKAEGHAVSPTVIATATGLGEETVRSALRRGKDRRFTQVGDGTWDNAV